MSDVKSKTLDAVIVGSGMAGMYMLHRLRKQGLNVLAVEAGTGVGGAWYWNRYPGCRCDVPSIEYSFSFSKELEQEWDWTEAMVSQPELERYLNHVADRFDLRKDIQFGTRVTSANYDESSARWTVTTDQGDVFDTNYCVMATGCLTIPNYPDINNADAFQGEVYHTATWPKEEVDFTGKRVAVIGCGSSGVQTIPIIAEKAEQLIAFQRSPVYTFPARNAPMKPEFLAQAKKDYPEIRAKQRNCASGIAGYTGPAKAEGEVEKPKSSRKILGLTAEQRQAELEEFGMGAIPNYVDAFFNEDANAIVRDMFDQSLKAIVKDPQKADALSPKDYPLHCKRPVIDTNYYEAFNKDSVSIVDLRESAIEELTATGLRTSDGSEYEFDILVYATGFDAMTGGLTAIDIRGIGGESIKEKWADGPTAYLGLQVSGFPNLFTITGPGSPSILSNVIVSIEYHCEWIDQTIQYLRDNDIKAMEAKQSAADAWADHVNEAAQGTMYVAPTCNSWYLGSNIDGKKRMFMPYLGGVDKYDQKCKDVIAKGYEGFALSR
ncbi:cyclohexanone monooxygenase [Gammaproteobacteria bacterium 53_120_T64]|nr:cyclohexanone monooxygenase [Gammaproteobacteria bacterium 53_120_T64]